MSDVNEVQAVFNGATFLKTDGFRSVKFPKNEETGSFLSGLHASFPGLISYQTQSHAFIEASFPNGFLRDAEAIFEVDTDPRLDILRAFIKEYAEPLPHSTDPNLTWSRPVPSAA